MFPSSFYPWGKLLDLIICAQQTEVSGVSIGQGHILKIKRVNFPHNSKTGNKQDGSLRKLQFRWWMSRKYQKQKVLSLTAEGCYSSKSCYKNWKKVYCDFLDRISLLQKSGWGLVDDDTSCLFPSQNIGSDISAMKECPETRNTERQAYRAASQSECKFSKVYHYDEFKWQCFSADRIIISNAFLFSAATFVTSPKE